MLISLEDSDEDKEDSSEREDILVEYSTTVGNPKYSGTGTTQYLSHTQRVVALFD